MTPLILALLAMLPYTQRDLDVYWAADPVIAPYMEAALRPWVDNSALYDAGPSWVPDIHATFRQEAGRPVAWTSCPYWPDRDELAGTCEIYVQPLYWAGLNGPQRTLLLTHEIGHALGFAENLGPGSVMGYWWEGFTTLDAESVRAIYGPDRPRFQYRIVIPTLAFDPRQ